MIFPRRNDMVTSVERIDRKAQDRKAQYMLNQTVTQKATQKNRLVENRSIENNPVHNKQVMQSATQKAQQCMLCLSPTIMAISLTILISGLVQRNTFAQAPSQAPGPGPGTGPVSAPSLPINPTSPLQFPAPTFNSGVGAAPTDLGNKGFTKGKYSSQSGDGASAPTSYQGGTMILSPSSRFSVAGRGRNVGAVRGPTPQSYVVKKGDTLSKISRRFFGSSRSWPKLWAKNSPITNPHWIYPGDTIFVGGPGDPVTGISRSGGQIQRAAYAYFKQRAIISTDKLEAAGKIRGSRKENVMLSENDEVYITPPEGRKFIPGNSYSVYRIDQSLESNGHILGYVVKVLGEIKVLSESNNNMYIGMIGDSNNVIERGDLVGKVEVPYKEIPAEVADNNTDNMDSEQDKDDAEVMKAKVIGSLNHLKLVASDEIIFIDKGANANFSEGYRLYVIRQGDGHRPLQTDMMIHDPEMPPEAVAEIALIDVSDECAAGVILRSVQEVYVGERVGLKNGLRPIARIAP